MSTSEDIPSRLTSLEKKYGMLQKIVLQKNKEDENTKIKEEIANLNDQIQLIIYLLNIDPIFQIFIYF